MASASCVVTKQTKADKSKLGSAPNDIYAFESQLMQIREEKELKLVTEEKQITQEITDFIEINEIKKAKKALQEGHKIIYKLSENTTPLEIVEISKSLGLPTMKLKKVLGSSMVIKKLIDCYVKNITTNKECNGYLKHCTEVVPLTCNDQLTPRVKIRMDLDYDTYYTKDDQFTTKFHKELCRQVFKCPDEKVQIVQVREGSVIVIIAVSVVALAFLGVIAFGIHLCRRNNDKSYGGICGGEDQEFYLGQKVLVRKRQRKKSYSGTVISPLSLDKDNNKTVRVRYDNEKPSMWKKEEVFPLNDESLISTEPGQDLSIDGAVHINENYAYIEAKKKKQNKKKKKSWYW